MFFFVRCTVFMTCKNMFQYLSYSTTRERFSNNVLGGNRVMVSTVGTVGDKGELEGTAIRQVC